MLGHLSYRYLVVVVYTLTSVTFGPWTLNPVQGGTHLNLKLRVHVRVDPDIGGRQSSPGLLLLSHGV